ncbi:hypothetical protein [Kineococcus rubinsiae]|uniref:hypothetical protein n=1 Tax=Kineococcus rubinsiae TaxID=2609562 RepID=UPI00142FC42F|nr:hypothetical protein [Kineococcus rubinsiae]NIZ90888.1 hypothetical protein [Kineococcus rubinsiae]
MTAPGPADHDGTAPDVGSELGTGPNAPAARTATTGAPTPGTPTAGPPSADLPTADLSPVEPQAVDPVHAGSRTGESSRRRWWAEAAALGGTSALLDCPDASRGALDLTTAHPSGLAQLLAGGPAALSSLVREAGAFADARQRARATHQRAEVLLEQHGLRTLAVAVGLVGWAGEGGVRRTPLLLRRCTLLPTGAAHDDFVVQLDPAVVVNPVLVSTVASELGVRLDERALAAAVVSGRGFDPAPALRHVREALHGVPGLRVEGRLVLGTFADPAADLLRDLRHRGGAVRDHRVVRALAEQAPLPAAGRVPGPAADPAVAVDDLPLPLDPAQRRAVSRVLAGEDLRIEAPTGTGATQVAAAVVAGLSAAGRTTLLVADAEAELLAVRDRLASAGAGTLVLHLVADLAPAPVVRSARAQRDAALHEVERRRAQPAEPPARPDVERLVEVLDAHATALHRPREPWGVSAHDALLALAELAGRPAAPSTTRRLRGASLQECASAHLPAWAARLEEAVQLGAFEVTPATSPWAGSRITTDEGAAAAARALTRVVDDELPRARALMATLTDEVGLRGASSVAEAGERVALLEGVRLTVSRFGPDIWSESLGDVSAATASAPWRREHGVRMGALTRWRLRRQAKALLRNGTAAGSNEQLHTWLLEARAQRLAWQRASQGKGAPHAPAGLADAQIAVASLRADLEALQAVLPPALLPDGPLRSLPLPELTALLRALHADTAALGPLPRRTQLLDELAAGGWQPLLEDLAGRWAGPGSLDLAAEVQAAWWSGVLEVLSLEDPLVGAVDAAGLRQARAELVLADATRRVLAGRRLRGALDERAASADASAADPLSAPARGATTAVLPCWALSPATAAVVLGGGVGPGGADEPVADVVLVLGAQASSTAALLPALSRARQVVVVGDPALPGPRVLRTADRADEPVAQGGRDLLAESAAVLTTERLDRQHATLDEELLPARLRRGQSTVPGARLGVRRLARTSSRPIGARRGPEALADLVHVVVQAHLEEHPGESLGVVTPDAATAAAVADLVRRRLPRPAGEEGVEDLLVAALERWPGRRRDHVVVVADSVHGPGAGLGVRVADGTGLDAGAADVALALTRARRRCTVVLDDSALEDGPPGHAAAPGVDAPADVTGPPDGRTELLRTALAWDAEDVAVPAAAADALVQRLAHACTTSGLPAVTGLGRSSAVPLAVRGAEGGGPALAIELDGADWAAADVLEREVSLPARWERAGWHYVRSLSVDVLRDPTGEAARVAGVWHDDLLAVRPAERSVDLPEGPAERALDGRAAGTGDERAPR